MLKLFIGVLLLLTSVASAEQKSDYLVRRNGQDYLLVVRAHGTPYKSSIWYKAQAVKSINDLTDPKLHAEREKNREPLAILFSDRYQRYHVIFTNEFHYVRYSRRDVHDLFDIGFWEYIWRANYYSLYDVSPNDIFVLGEEVPSGPPK